MSATSIDLISLLVSLPSAHPKYLHDFIAKVVDHFHGDPPGLRFVERSRRVAVQRVPGILVDLRLERCLERFVRIIGAEEIGMPDKEALFVVVGVDEPAGDAFGAVAAHLAGVRMEDIHAMES